MRKIMLITLLGLLGFLGLAIATGVPWRAIGVGLFCGFGMGVVFMFWSLDMAADAPQRVGKRR